MLLSVIEMDARLDGLKQGVLQGRNEGLSEGLLRGRNEGLLQGFSDGVMKTASVLKAMGFSIEQIMQATNLSKAEVERL